MRGPSDASGVDTSCADPTANNIYSPDDFFSIVVTAANQVYFDSLIGDEFDQPLSIDDVLILVGMHVTSREMERWTWQTFWWAANPDSPMAPSSDTIAAARGPNLSHKAAHFAMASAYSMLVPAQPLVGGRQGGNLLPAYNPHLEAGFGTGTFGETKNVETPDGAVTTDLGVQSNCMSCHMMAGFETENSPYVSNFYVPLDASNFDGGLRLDTAWSLK